MLNIPDSSDKKNKCHVKEIMAIKYLIVPSYLYRIGQKLGKTSKQTKLIESRKF